MSVWIVRVSQQFEVEAADANAAHDFATKAKERKIRGATLTDSAAATARKADVDAILGADE